MISSKRTTPAGENLTAQCSEVLRGRSVLMADDCPVSRLITGSALRRHGAKVQEAADGTEAVRYALNTPFDFILMDVQMPIMDGLAAVRDIRAAPVTQVSIFALSAGDTPGEEAACLSAGMDAVLSKPVSIARLCRQLTEKIGQAAPVVAAGNAILSDALLLEICNGDEALARRLLRVAANELPKASQQIGLALAAGNVLRIARLCHRVRPCLASLRQTALHESALHIETLLAGGGHLDMALESTVKNLCAGVYGVAQCLCALKGA